MGKAVGKASSKRQAPPLWVQPVQKIRFKFQAPLPDTGKLVFRTVPVKNQAVKVKSKGNVIIPLGIMPVFVPPASNIVTINLSAGKIYVFSAVGKAVYLQTIIDNQKEKVPVSF